METTQIRTGLSVVVPVYNEEDATRRLYEKIREACEPLGDFEIVFVDDGSKDRTFKVLQEIHDEDSRVKVLRFGNAVMVLMIVKWWWNVNVNRLG